MGIQDLADERELRKKLRIHDPYDGEVWLLSDNGHQRPVEIDVRAWSDRYYVFSFPNRDYRCTVAKYQLVKRLNEMEVLAWAAK